MPELLSDEEVQALIFNLATTRGNKGFTDVDAQVIVKWGEDARLSASLLNLALTGVLALNVNADGTVGFRATMSDDKLAKGGA